MIVIDLFIPKNGSLGLCTERLGNGPERQPAIQKKEMEIFKHICENFEVLLGTKKKKN